MSIGQLRVIIWIMWKTMTKMVMM